MRLALWVGLGAAGSTLCSALAVRLAPAHVQPDWLVVVVVFLALRYEALAVAAAALAMGYLAGRQALAPVGLFELSLCAVGVGVYVTAGSLSGSGTLFFGAVCAAATMALHALMFALLWWQRGQAGFASVATAALLPAAGATFVVAVLTHPLLLWLDRRLTQKRHEGLSWR